MPVTHFKHVHCLTTPKSWLVSGRMSSADSESNSVLTEVEIDDFFRALVTTLHGLGTSDEVVIPTALRGVEMTRVRTLKGHGHLYDAFPRFSNTVVRRSDCRDSKESTEYNWHGHLEAASHASHLVRRYGLQIHIAQPFDNINTYSLVLCPN